MIPHARRLGLKLVAEQDQYLIVELPFSTDLEEAADSGIMANGAITTLLDTALGAVSFHQFGKLKRIATLDLRVDYFSPPKAFSSIFAKVECTKITPEVIFVRGLVYCDDENEPIAQSVAAFSYAEIPLSVGMKK